jgi:HlyD family secretion protein
MSVTAEIATRFRTNVLTVPIASVTTRLPKEKDKKKDGKMASADPPATNSIATNSIAANGSDQAGTNICATNAVTDAKPDKKAKGGAKPIEVVFLMEGEHAKMMPVKIGISDDNYWEITEGLTEGQEIIAGGYRAISRDLEDGKKIKKGPPAGEKDKEGQPEKKD